MVNGNESAYPHVSANDSDFVVPGLTKREYFAGLAMQGLCASPEAVKFVDIATDSVRMADALLTALSGQID